MLGKNNIKEWLKNLIQTNNRVKRFASRIYYIMYRSKKIVKGSENKIQYVNSFLKRCNITVIGNNNSIFIDEGTRLSNLRIYIRGNNHKLYIGKNCIIKRGTIWFEDSSCQILINSDTTIESALLAATEPKSSISIGVDCMLSNNIEIRTGDSHSIISKETGKRVNYAQDVKIGNHVWIGTDVHILKGVKIEDNCVVGIKSLVTKDVPQNSIAAGIPAEVKKENITWDRERIYI